MLEITTHQNHPAIESSLLYLGQLDRFRTQDSDFGNSLYKQVTAGKRLTDSQHEHACLLLWRYVATDKLRVPAQGVLKRWLAERQKLYPYTPPVTVLETAFMGQVSVSDQGMLVIRLPNNYQRWVPAIKSLHVQNRQVATYNHDTRLWYVSLDWLDELMGVLPETHFTYTQDVLQVHAAMKQKQLEAQATIERKRQQHQQRLDTLLAAVDLDAPLQNGWLLHPHQKEAVRFAFEHQNVLIGDEQGVGKTLEALVTAKAYQQAFGYSVVCIVPVTAKDNWLREAKAVGVSVNVFSNSFAGIPKPSAVTTDFVLIVDESHVFKNLQAQRTKNLMALGKSPHVQAIICMTGTPIDNGSPANIFSTLKLLGHRLGASKAAFEKRYCGCTNPELVERPRQQPHYLSNLRELRRILTVEEPVMIRRKLADVVDLPPFTRQMVDGVLTPEAEATYHKTFLALQEEYNRRCADNEISADGWHLVLLNHLRHAGSLAKVGSVVDLALQFLYGQDGDEGEQVVVFTVFKDTAQQIAEQIRAKGFTVDLLTGETKQSDRDPVVQKFQQHKTDVLVCTIQAGGVAITLTAASKVILADRDWRLNEQAESRINRISQTKPTTAYWVRHTLVDAYIDNILIDKAETSDLVLDGYSTGLDGIDWSREARHLLDLVFA
ncbi:MAG: hypothetical protein IM613_12075 [Cytophagales bacterium]|jgi:SNF2-related domain/Helicase conserved C-terminal domain|nr:hypothetical protein [Cytophagales bacterium]